MDKAGKVLPTHKIHWPDCMLQLNNYIAVNHFLFPCDGATNKGMQSTIQISYPSAIPAPLRLTSSHREMHPIIVFKTWNDRTYCMPANK